MSDTPFVSVIVPTYNREKVLFRALDSIVNQTYKNFELLVIDDGSTDETETKFKEWNVHHPVQITYKKTDNRGVSAARNLAVEMAKGEWVSFLDSDDEWLPHKLETQVSYIQENPHYKLVHGEEIWIRNGKRVNPKNIHQKSGGDIFERSLKLCLISPSAVILKKDLLLEMGGFDPAFVVCEDYDLWLKITSENQVGFIQDPIIKKYGGHEDQLSRKYFAMDYYRVKSMFNLLEKNYFQPERNKVIREEILLKGKILLEGYKKHNNLEHYDEILAIVQATSY